MLSIILTLIVGLFITFFAFENTAPVSVQLAGYTFAEVPLYLVIALSFLVGIFIAWLISLIDFISSAFTIFGKDRKINETKKAVDNLNQKIHQLELENAQLNERIKSSTSQDPIKRM